MRCVNENRERSRLTMASEIASDALKEYFPLSLTDFNIGVRQKNLYELILFIFWNCVVDSALLISPASETTGDSGDRIFRPCEVCYA